MFFQTIQRNINYENMEVKTSHTVIDSDLLQMIFIKEVNI